MITSSTPTLTEFNPHDIPWQFSLIKDVRTRFDYSLGTHECLLSGSVGSGKSLPAAHLIATHVLLYGGANFGIGRRALPDLKDTLCVKLREHLFNSGVDYRYFETSGDFAISNGSKITAFSWADKNYKKLGSYELSGFAMEEATENQDDKAYQMVITRIGRLPHIKESIMLALANPDDPGHWLAKRFDIRKGRPHGQIEHPTATRHVYYSRTEQNRFLPQSYIDGLKTNLDPKMARRLIYGEWVEINAERIYHAYESDRNYNSTAEYQINSRLPIRWTWDFNIAPGKPLSCVFFQYDGQTFHFFDEIIVEGFRTEDALEEAAERGLLDHRAMYVVHGDASGKHSDTRSKLSDYDIIKKFMSTYKTKDGRLLQFRVDVPPANPPVRTRHNVVNSHCLNENGEVRLVVYKRCKTLDEGMRLTALKDKAHYQEDDSKSYQHCTTALGYGLCSTLANVNRQGPDTVKR